MLSLPELEMELGVEATLQCITARSYTPCSPAQYHAHTRALVSRFTLPASMDRKVRNQFVTCTSLPRLVLSPAIPHGAEAFPARRPSVMRLVRSDFLFDPGTSPQGMKPVL